MNQTLHLIEHKNVTQEELDEIIKIKTTAWNYDYNSQVQWLKTNLKDKDYHVFLTIAGKKVAYANLIAIKVKVNKTFIHSLGIGNVVAKTKGHGFGRLLMKQINQYLIDVNLMGVLFCQDSLISFYEKLSWEVLDKEKLEIPALYNSKTPIKIMIFNSKINIENLSYIENLF